MFIPSSHCAVGLVVRAKSHKVLWAWPILGLRFSSNYRTPKALNTAKRLETLVTLLTKQQPQFSLPRLLATLLFRLSKVEPVSHSQVLKLKHFASFLNYLQWILSAFNGLGVVLDTEDAKVKKTWTCPRGVYSIMKNIEKTIIKMVTEVTPRFYRCIFGNLGMTFWRRG